MHHHIWRIDPTGQFWKVDAAAVGRGAGAIEATILRHVYDYTVRHENENSNSLEIIDNDHDTDQALIQSRVSNHHVRSFLSDMSVEDGLILACRLLVQSLPTTRNNKVESLSIGSMQLLERGLQAVVMGRKPLPEVLTTYTLRKLAEEAVRGSI